ncbi:MAG TPA: ParB/RepB/Spo0J family partition protein [Rhizomicrobium sp.]|jgi:ParB family chromosome partitioning protein|nr:ParB/RepB/Spo0J family partition protein [Rhizomicrobium sp.]
MSNRLKSIPLCQLRPSKANIRKTNRLADIEAMANNIREKDLLENLVVQSVPPRNGHAPSFEVVAGSRRFAALKLLAKQRKVSRDYPVRCLVLDRDESAVEVSLAENMLRVPVHPADQFGAFAAIAKEGLSIEEMAARFGVSSTFVEQRLKLASVSPRLVEEYRGGAMTLEQLTAFTLSGSHAAQEEVWFERTYAEMPAHLIRRLLTEAKVCGDDPRARFIGTKAYEAAGGLIIRDLFDAEDEGYFEDGQLLDRLVQQKLQQKAADVHQEGWQWVEVHADFGLVQFGRFGRMPAVRTALSESDQSRHSSLGERYDELVTALEEGDEEAAAELDRLSAEITDVEDKQESWTDEQKRTAGAIVALAQDGSVEVVRGLLRPEACSESATSEEAKAPSNGAINGKSYADSVLLDLSAYRTAALRELLAGNPRTALTALLHTLVTELFQRDTMPSCLSLSASAVSLERASETVGDSKATKSFSTRHEAWVQRLPHGEYLWQSLEQLEDNERHDLLAYCVALTLNALDGRAGRNEEHVMQLASRLKLDMREWWQPTQANFLGRLKKEQILAAVSEGVSQQASWRLAKLKKERMAKEAEKLLSDSPWLPEFLRARESSSNATT